MKHKRFVAFLPLFCALAFAPAAMAQNSWSLGSDTAAVNTGVAILPLTLESDSDVQGFQAIVEWTGGGTGADLVPTAVLADADVIVTRVEANYAILGVVVDSDGTAPESIPAGSAVVAHLHIAAGPDLGVYDVNFVDGVYATVGNDPVLDNLFVIAGQSIGVSDGLGMAPGSFEIIQPPPGLTIESGVIPEGGCADVRILMTNDVPVEGFVTAICHPAGITLDSISVGSAAAVADFSATEISGDGGTLGVVLDLFSPFGGEVIPPGADQHVATYRYCGGVDGVTYPLTFCDGVLGSPLKDNILVVGGLSLGVSDGTELTDGELVGVPAAQETDCGDGIDNDGDGDTDCDDDDCDGIAPCIIEPAPITFVCSGRDGAQLEASRGSELEVCFGLVINEDDVVGHAQPDHIQGFSMAVTFCDYLTCTSDDLDIEGTILEALGAEFVSLQCDNDPNDGDGKELIIGVLIDALPPFDGATIAPSFINEVQPIGYVTFDVSEEAECGSECEIAFTDGINGIGRVPTKNLIAFENHSASPLIENCTVNIVEMERFHRGDCNFSLMGSMAVDIADAAAVISYLFLTGSWRFEPGCLDACDCQDDGRVDLADAVCILQYLFLQGNTPPAPGPGFDPDTQTELDPGVDPTDDKLDCELGKECVLVAH